MSRTSRDDRLSLGAIHFFVQNQGRILLTLEECGVEGYTVKHPAGRLHGTRGDPWVVRLDDKRICDFFVEADGNGLRFRVVAAEGYAYIVAAFEMLSDQDDDESPPESHLN